MKQYIDALEFVLKNGKLRKDRTGTGTLGVFGYQNRYNLKEGFPAVTTKKLAWKSVLSELLWFLEGSGDEKRLKEILFGDRNSDKRTIWTGNANELGNPDSPNKWLKNPHRKGDGDLGRVYGVQWRSWQDADGNVIDQLLNLINDIINDPYSRRHILTAWNVADLNKMALPPCHTFAQFYVQDDELSCQLYQRSADMFLGVPFNIASYALFTHIVAQLCGLKVGDLVHTFGDAHIYVDHIEQVKEQITRKPYDLPTLKMNQSIKTLDGFTMDDFELLNYKHHPTITAKMAV